MWNHSDSKTHIIQRMNSLYKSFLTRINLTVWIILVIVLIIALQNTLAEEIKIGAVIPRDIRGALELTLTNQIWLGIKILALVPIVVFWLLDRRKYLRLALLFSLGLLTFELLSSISFLVISLTSDTSR